MTSPTPVPRDLFENSLRKILELKAELQAVRARNEEGIAIVGMACRLPGGVATPEDYWNLLLSGRDPITPVPATRWDAQDMPAAVRDRLPAVGWGGFLEQDLSGFDASFFGISPVEAQSFDPQQRLLLEASWEALERAGIPPSTLMRTRTGVFLGMASLDYRDRVLAAPVEDWDIYATTGNNLCTAAGRLSYFFGFEGPCLTVETACSSSLVALHQACLALRSGEADLSLVGGANLILSPFTMALLAQTEALSPDGRCKAFDASANGFVRSEGCGVIVLKRLSDAHRDGDEVLAVIRGSAVNHDGRATGLTAPNVNAQIRLLRQALASAGLTPDQVGFVETHGTGTSLGDPIEAEALKAVFGGGRRDGQPLRLGAVKSQIGHLESAAGLAGLIKTVLVLRHGQIPGNLHFRDLNPRIRFDGAGIEVAARNRAWPADGQPRRAGVSAFGISGTNVHVVLEESPATAGATRALEADDAPAILALSAKSEEALRELAARYRTAMEPGGELSDLPLAQVGEAALRQRDAMPVRLSLAARDVASMVERLKAAQSAPLAATPSKKGPVFVYSGQGSPWRGMALDLLDGDAVFRAAMDEIEAAWAPLADWTLESALRAGGDDWPLGRTSHAQPVIFAVQVAVTRWLAQRGATPAAVMGHSLGEITAAHVAGMLTLPQALSLIRHRSTLMQRQAGGGAMIALTVGREAGLALAGEFGLSLAGENGSTSIVLAGDRAAVERLDRARVARRVRGRVLDVDCAFHSAHMLPLGDELAAALATLQCAPGVLPLFSTVTGSVEDGETLGASHWVANMCATVEFATAVREALRDGYTHFVEISPQPQLAGDIAAGAAQHQFVAEAMPTLRRGGAGRLDLLEALAALQTQGLAPLSTGKANASPSPSPRIAASLLPTYPWQRERHWLEAVPQNIAARFEGRREVGRPSEAILSRRAAGPADAGAAAQTRTPQAFVVDSIAQLLRMAPERVHLDHSFFDIGIDSLIALQLSNRLNEHYGTNLSAPELIEAGSVAAVVALLPAGEGATATGGITKADIAAVSLLDQVSARHWPELVARLKLDVGSTLDGSAIERALRARHDEFEVSAASFGQSSMYFVHEMAPDSAGYNVMFAMRIDQNIRSEDMQAALRLLVRRYSVLRTSYLRVADRVLQKVHVCGDLDYEYLDATLLSDDDIAEAMEGFGHRPYDLEHGRVFRAALFGRGAARSDLVVAMHHIACDAGSMQTLLDELQDCFAVVTGRRDDTKTPPSDYADFARWEHLWLQTAEAAQALVHWKQALATPPLRAELGRLARAGAKQFASLTPRRDADRSFEGDEYQCHLDAELTARLKRYAQEAGVTLYNVLLAGFFATLNRLTDIEDTAVGAYFNMRVRPEFERTIGYFVNSVVLRARPEPSKSFATLVVETRDMLTAALKHQKYPLALLARELDPPREVGRHIWFDYVINWTSGDHYHSSNAYFMGADGPALLDDRPLPGRPLPIQRNITQFDLALNMGENAGRVFGAIVYNTSLFDREAVETLMTRYRHLLSELVAQPDRAIGELDLLGPEERQIVLEDWNATRSAFEETGSMFSAFAEQAARTPRAVALSHRGAQLRYEDLRREASEIASSLRALGAGPGVPVGICLPRGPAMIAAMFGVLETGAAYLPLDPNYPADRLAYMVRDSATSLIVTDERGTRFFQDVLAATLVRENGSSTVADRRTAPSRAVLDPSAAYIIYTSGSTGLPKGVVLGHRSCMALFHWADETFTRAQIAVVLASTTISFDISVFEIFYPLARGGRIVLVESALFLSEEPQRDEVTLINTVPSVMEAVLAQGALPDSVNTVTLVGEPLRQALVDRIYEAGRVSAVYNLYGPTEDTVFSTWALIPRDAAGEPVIGRPMQNTRAYVLNPKGQPLPPFHRGELYLAGEGLAIGYHDRDDLNRERFPPDPFGAPGTRMYRTGDIATFRPDGVLECFGRTDSQVKIRGHRIELDEIEILLSQLDGVAQAAVRLYKQGGAGEAKIAAYVVCDKDEVSDSELEARLRRHLQSTLPAYMVPSYFTRLASMPQTPNGKIDRKALPDPVIGGGPSVAAVSTGTTQQRLAQIWSAILDVPAERIAHDRSFYELGGSSLQLAGMVADIAKDFGQRLGMTDLFRFQTIDALAGRLDKGDEKGARAVGSGNSRGHNRKDRLEAMRRKQTS
jgi:amino acid adenylation domain-containing protein